jgi:hypothetical protein
VLFSTVYESKSSLEDIINTSPSLKKLLLVTVEDPDWEREIPPLLLLLQVLLTIVEDLDSYREMPYFLLLLQVLLIIVAVPVVIFPTNIAR